MNKVAGVVGWKYSLVQGPLKRGGLSPRGGIGVIRQERGQDCSIIVRWRG
jgi:hypothetical protein